MPSFEITVLGSSGGPLEGSTCSILLKPKNITYKEIIENDIKDCLAIIDAGSFMGKFSEILNDEIYGNPVRLTQRLLNNYRDTLSLEQFNSNSAGIVVKSDLGLKSLSKCPMEITFTVLDLINTCLITHSHLDHVSALAINSAAFGSDYPKNVYGLPKTIKGLQDHIFNDVIWPNLPNIENRTLLRLIELQELHDSYQQINAHYRTIPFLINHGNRVDMETYHSTSFLVEDIETNDHLLVFGDVESDEDSKEDHNMQIWKFIKPLIQNGKLKTIIIECSTPNVLPNEPLFGHLTPNTLFSELLNLSAVLQGESTSTCSSALNGLTVMITHVKEKNSPVDPKKIILRELNELNEKHGLGIDFIMLLTGQTYVF